MPPTVPITPPLPRRARRLAWLPALLLAGLLLAITAPLIFLGAGGTNEHADEREYHLPIIRLMADQWPSVDIVNYESATTPGFHLLMAGILRATGSDMLMHVVNGAFGIGLVLSVWWFARRAAGAWPAAALTLPLACNTYVIGATIWLTTDNAALLFVALALGGAVFSAARPGRSLAQGVFAGLAVSVRQVHVWLAAAIGLAGLVTALDRAAARRRGDARGPGPWDVFIAACAGAAMPVLVVLFFAWQWGWKLMPNVHGHVLLHLGGPNPAAPAFALTLIAGVGIFFLPVALEQVLRLRLRDWAFWGVIGIGLVLALVPETSYFWKPRSYGWVWRIVEKFPDVRERSIVIAAGAPVGAVVLLLLYRAADAAGRRVPAIILLLSLLGWLSAQTMNSMAWQRYFEPITLIGMAWLSALGVRQVQEADTRPLLARVWPWAGVIVLAIGELGLVIVTTGREVIRSYTSG